MLQQKCQKLQSDVKVKDGEVMTLTSKQNELQQQTVNMNEHVTRIEEQHQHKVAALDRQLTLTRQELEALRTASEEMASNEMDRTKMEVLITKYLLINKSIFKVNTCFEYNCLKFDSLL